MKTKSITKVTLLTVFVMSVITAVTLNSCQKEAIKTKAEVTKLKSKGTINFDVIQATALNDIMNMAFSGKKTSKGLLPPGSDSSGCTTITSDTIDKPSTYTYNYGTGCIGSDGMVRSGVLVMTYNTPDLSVVNNVITFTYQNYSVNNILYNGSISFINIGPNGNGHQVITESGAFSSFAQNQIVPDTLTVNYNYEWIAGEGSSPASNYQFSITGGCTSTQLDSIVITTPLIKNAKTTNSCNYYIQGTEYFVSNTLLGPQYKYIDFGNPGGCSGDKAVTQNGITTIVTQ